MIFRGSVVEDMPGWKIAELARALRRELEIDDWKKVPIVPVVESYALEAFQVIETDEMPGYLGRARPDLGELLIRADIYDSAIDGNLEARETMAHELGHFVLHRGLSLNRRASPNGIIRLSQDSEWQADEFAKYFLAPSHIIAGHPAATVSSLCGIPLSSALSCVKRMGHRW